MYYMYNLHLGQIQKLYLYLNVFDIDRLWI